MIFNNAQFMGVPWETIICEINKKIPISGFNNMNEYIKYFLSFFKKNNHIFTDSKQRSYFTYYLITYYSDILKVIKDTVDHTLKKVGPLNENSIKRVVSKVIKKELNKAKTHIKNEKESSISLDMSRKIVKNYGEETKKAQELVFQKIPLSIQAKRNLLELARYFFSLATNDDTNTGVVIAGFGEKEVFPSVKSFILDGLFDNKLKYMKGVNTVIGKDSEGSVLAFAQREMVNRFMEGVDPEYRNIESIFMSRVAEKFSNAVIKSLKKYNPSEKKRLSLEIRKNCHDIFDKYRKAMDEKIEEMFTNPIVDVVAVLPKSDLATLAESLVSLTTLKRKFSTEKETVSEPIDVAVICKKDGFVWIKKKTYHENN